MNEKSTPSEVIMSPLPSQAVIVNPLAETLLVHEDTLLCMDQITIKTPTPKCRLDWCLIEFIDWRYSQPWYFRPLLWTSVPLTLSLVHLHPLPLPCAGVCIYTVCNRVGRGGIGLCGEQHIQELYTVYLTRFRTYKIALPSQTKT